MLFSASKSITSLLIGAATDDGLIGSVLDPVTTYLPELADGGFDRVTIEDLLRMDSNLDYIEDDNPFGIHVEFNYTADLEGDILNLELRDEPDEAFRYKSGDNAVLGSSSTGSSATPRSPTTCPPDCSHRWGPSTAACGAPTMTMD